VNGLQSLDALIGDYPRDPRLHFLRGSLLAARQNYGEAREAMRLATALGAPGTSYDAA
jgi:hypothetical protein